MSIKDKEILVTGCAGFIGSALAIKCLQNGFNVVGIDNINNYYDVNLKEARLNRVITKANDLSFTFLKPRRSSFPGSSIGSI